MPAMDPMPTSGKLPAESTAPEKSMMVRIGDWFFWSRNVTFPAMLLAMFALFKPAYTQFGSHNGEIAMDIFAALVVLSGLALRFATIGWAYIDRGGRNKKVYASKLVSEGYFALSRNPLYLGNMLIYSGVFLWHGSLPVIVIGIPLFYAIYSAIIAAEEHFLTRTFGDDYRAYVARVPRWIPDLRRRREVTAGMSFSLKRSVVKDYTTIYNALVMVILIEVLDRYWWQSRVALIHISELAAVLIVLLSAAGVAVKTFKKRDHHRMAAAQR
jgi:protein-S-isoprenylcysteine O-methyltransferase Ste14